jgi:hypothetical protein
VGRQIGFARIRVRLTGCSWDFWTRLPRVAKPSLVGSFTACPLSVPSTSISELTLRLRWRPSTSYPKGETTIRKIITFALTTLLFIPPVTASPRTDPLPEGSLPGQGRDPGDRGRRMGALPPDVEVGDRTLAKWSALWWKWALAFPVNDNPVLDPTGKKTAKFGDLGPVFFLAGAFPGPGFTSPVRLHRTATIPADKFIFFPVVAIVNDNVGNPQPLTISELYAQLASLVGVVTELHASLDGVAVPNLHNHRVISPVFSYTLQLNNNVVQQVTGNITGDAVGTIFPVVADGFYLMLPPLAPGRHVVNFGGSINFGSSNNFGGSIPSSDFTIDITYEITVTATEVEQPAVLVP